MKVKNCDVFFAGRFYAYIGCLYKLIDKIIGLVLYYITYYRSLV